MFQRRHYEAIATIMRDAMPDKDGCYARIMERFIKMFREDNPNFDENRFRIACAGFGY
jgi:hypothetical protein